MRKLLIVFAAFAFVAGSVIPALATDWSFYGKAAMFTYMEDRSKEITKDQDDDDLVWDAFNSSNRFGTKAQAGNIGGQFEVGIDTHYAKDANSFHVRLAYGYWNFGAGTLVVGQDYTPGFFIVTDTIWADQSWVRNGSVYPQRVPQLKLKLKGLQVALIETNKAGNFAGCNDQDVSMPKIEASYDLPVGPLALHIFGGFNSYENVAVTPTTETSYDVDSHLFGIGARFGSGPFYLNAALWFSENPGNYGVLQDNTLYTASLTGTKVYDVDSMVYALVAGFKVTPTIKLEAGYSMISNEQDIAGGGTAEAETSTMYVQAKITLAKGVSITPEIGMIDYGDVEPGTGERGERTYYGARWLIEF